MKGKAFPVDVFIAATKEEEYDMATIMEQQFKPQGLPVVSNIKMASHAAAAQARQRPIIGAESALAKVSHLQVSLAQIKHLISPRRQKSFGIPLQVHAS